MRSNLVRMMPALLAVSFCGLAAATSFAEEGWGVSHEQKSLSWRQFQAALRDTKLAASFEKPSAKLWETGQRIDVVELGVSADVVEVPSATSAALETLGRAVQSFRNAIADDPTVVRRLETSGYGINDVLAATRASDGSVTVFVRSSA